MSDFQSTADFIWGIADRLRGDYQRREYPDVILPMVVLRRLDQAMELTRDAVRAKYLEFRDKLENLDPVLRAAAGNSPIYNTSEYYWKKLRDDRNNLPQNLINYLNGFSPDVADIIEKFDFRRQIARLQTANLLPNLFDEFTKIDLHPDRVDNLEMGRIFEHLIYRFNQDNNQTSGEHFTPREVIRLMVRLLFKEDDPVLSDPNKIITIYDPACGTGGMLTEAKEFILKPFENKPKNPTVELFGQEINPTAFAVAKSDFLLKNEDPRRIHFGNSFSEDGHFNKRFRYVLSNPPFGVEWKKVEYIIKREYETQGFEGRFGAGLPRINDGSLLFLQHMLSKQWKETESESTRTSEPIRIITVFNGSPLFTGDAGSGESNIRRWIIEKDWLEGIVALPDQLFYNTGISTYLWVLDNHKSEKRKGKIQLVNATGEGFFQKMRKSLGNKRNEIMESQYQEIAAIYHAFSEGENCRIFDNEDFGYRRIRVDRPLRWNFSAAPERLERLPEQPGFAALAESKKQQEADQQADIAAGKALQAAIIEVLKQLPTEIIKDPKRFLPLLEKTLKPFKLREPVKNAILKALTERDETAEPVPAKKGEGYEPDSELRDYENVPLQWAPSIYDENVPLKENVYEYFAREVKPYIGDAWIDEKFKDEKDQKTGIVGYEISFNRYFYKYQPPEPLEVIEEKIAILEKRDRGIAECAGMTKYKPYSTYKPSGVEWLGDIPKHWQLQRLKFVAPPSTEKLAEKPSNKVYLGLENIESKTGRLLLDLPTEIVDSIVTVFYRGDILFGKLRPYLAKVICADFDGVCTSELLVLRPLNRLVYEKYLFYLLLSDGFINFVDSMTYGAKMPRANPSQICNILVSLPSLQEQKSIAHFLDRETTRIDTLIAKKRELIGLLEKKRGAIVTEAVTKGCDRDVPMKDSGLEWLEKIPAHWEVRRLKFVATVQTGLTLGKDYKDRDVVSCPYLRVANVQDGFLDLETITEVSIPVEDVSRYELKPSDVLMTEGGDFDKLGRGYVWEGQIEICLHQNHIFAVRPYSEYLNSYYLSALMMSHYGKAYFTSTSQQTTNLATTNRTKLGNFPFPIPNKSEQKEILEYINHKNQRITLTLTKLHQQTSDLQKYHQALITAAVTGKIDVREEVESDLNREMEISQGIKR